MKWKGEIEGIDAPAHHGCKERDGEVWGALTVTNSSKARGGRRRRRRRGRRLQSSGARFLLPEEVVVVGEHVGHLFLPGGAHWPRGLGVMATAALGGRRVSQWESTG